MPEIRALSRPCSARAHDGTLGPPVIDRIDLSIFEHRYFTRCMEHPSCADWCCSHGVDVDEGNVARILARADELERATGISRDRWFAAEVTRDPEFPSGAYRRTRIENGACVFLDRASRGCRIHAFCLGAAIDYHELKPMVSTLFPLTFDEGLLHPSEEVHDHTLVCLGEGPSVYRGVRDELAYYFGPGLVEELDAIEAERPRMVSGAASARRLRVVR